MRGYHIIGTQVYLTPVTTSTSWSACRPIPPRPKEAGPDVGRHALLDVGLHLGELDGAVDAPGAGLDLKTAFADYLAAEAERGRPAA